MLRDLPTLNTGASRDQRRRLLQMSNIIGCALSTKWMVNLMVCTWNIQPTNTMNGKNKIRERDKPRKRSGTSVQGIVENKVERLEE